MLHTITSTHARRPSPFSSELKCLLRHQHTGSDRQDPHLSGCVQRKHPRGRMPFCGERERVSTTDSSINAGNHFIQLKRRNQRDFSAPTSDDPWRPVAICGGFMPVPRCTNCEWSALFEEPTQPPQDPQSPFFPLRANTHTRLSMIAAAIARIKTVVIVCQSIPESSGENRLSASQLWPACAVSQKIAYNWPPGTRTCRYFEA